MFPDELVKREMKSTVHPYHYSHARIKMNSNPRYPNIPSYSSTVWKKLRGLQLAREALCRYCARQGIRTRARIVDHIKPHRGDMRLFLDPSNLQSLCKTCHDSAKQTEENRGVKIGCNASGQPLDPNHPWNISSED